MAKKTTNKSLSDTTQKLSVLDGTVAYAELKQKVTQAGILNRAYKYYTFLILFAFFGFFFSAFEIYTLKSSLMLALWGILFSAFAIQLGGLMHDAGHKAICKTSKMGDFLGYIFSFLIVFSYDNWVLRHNKHHAHTNEDEEDPQIDVPILSFSEERFLAKKGIEKKLSKYQAYLFFPMLTLGAFAQRIGDFIYLLRQEKTKRNIIELSFYSVGLFIWFLLPFFIFDFHKAIFVFLIVHLSSGFYMTNIFAPNHKGMPQIKKGTKISFMEQQIITSRNITANWFNDILYAGLNYQIEHHLFPNCPRNKLKSITPYLHEFCKKLQLEYTSVSIIESNKIILGELSRIAKTARSSA